METPKVLAEESLSCFLEKHGGNRAKTELLAFWSRHPNAKFSRLVLSHALDQTKLDTDRALKDMVESGLVDTYTRNSVTLFSLTTNEEIRRPVLEMAALDWNQWQLVLKHVEQQHNLLIRNIKTITGG